MNPLAREWQNLGREFERVSDAFTRYVKARTAPVPVRETGESGRLESIGLTWEELREGTGLILGVLLVIFLLLSIVFLLDAFQSSNKVPHVFLVGGCWLAMALIAIAAVSMRGKPRGAMFHADGRVSFRGFGGGWSVMAVSHPDIASIEAVKTEVVIYTRDGESIRVSKDLVAAQSHKVAVQLTRALAELRESLANPNAPKRDPAVAQQRRVID